MMAYSIDGATDGAIQDILCRHTQNSTRRFLTEAKRHYKESYGISSTAQKGV